MKGKTDYFLELYGRLPRAGPGDNTSTRKAFSMMTALPPRPRILDIGCGPGVQTLELARLSQGKITALDNLPHMLQRVNRAAAESGLAAYITTVLKDMNAMDFPEESFDAVWSEGAIYFMGFKNGLSRVKSLLKSKGYAAVTEAVWREPDPPGALRRFWEEYPEIAGIGEKLKVIEDLGYRDVGHFVLPDSSWTEPYYQPLEERIREMEPDWRKIPEAWEVLAEARREIEMFRKYHAFYGYAFFVMQKG